MMLGCSGWLAGLIKCDEIKKKCVLRNNNKKTHLSNELISRAAHNDIQHDQWSTIHKQITLINRFFIVNQKHTTQPN